MKVGIITMQLPMDYLNMHVFVYNDWSGGQLNGLMKLLSQMAKVNCGKCLIGCGNLNEFLSMGE